MNAPPAAARRLSPWGLRGLALGLSLIIGLAGWFYFASEQAEARRATHHNLATIADAKARQIALWRAERLADVRYLYRTPFALRRAADTLRQPDTETTRQMFADSLAARFADQEFDRAILLNDKLEPVLTWPDKGPFELSDAARAAVTEAWATRKVVVTDLHLLPSEPTAHMDFVMPLIGRRAGNREEVLTAGVTPADGDRLMGALLFQLRADRFLYPLVKAWPLPSATAEAALLRQEADAVVYLSELRHQTNTALTLRVPLTETNRLSVRALTGEEGVEEMVDYRGVPVLVTSSKVPNSPWYLLAKVDLEEIYAPHRKTAVMAALLIGVLMSLAYLGLGLLWRDRELAYSQAELAREQAAEAALRASEERFRQLAEHIQSVFWTGTRDHAGFEYVSPAYERIWGRPAAAIVQDPLAFLATVHPEDRERVAGHLRHYPAGQPGEYALEFRILRPDGTVRWIRDRGFPVRDAAGGVERLVGVADDITAARESADELRASERRFRELLEQIHLLSLTLDTQGNVTFANDYLLGVIGWSREEVLGQNWFDRVSPPESEIREIFAQAMQTGAVPTHYENDILTRTGERRFVAWNNTVLRDAVGQITGVAAIGEDITEKRQLREALEQRVFALTQPLAADASVEFDLLFNREEIQRVQDEFAAATGVASLITRPDGTPITRPSNFTRFCRDLVRGSAQGCAHCLKSDALLGRPHPSGPVVQPCLSGGLWDAGASISVGGRHVANWLIGQVRDATQTEDAMRAYAREIEVDEEELVTAFREVPAMSQAQFRQVAQALFTLANQLSVTAYQNLQQARFIAERHRAEAALRQSERRLREAQALGRMGDWTLEAGTRRFSFSAEMFRLVGWEPNQTPPTLKQLLERFLPADATAVAARFERTLTAGESWQCEASLRLPEGGQVWHRLICVAVKDHAGRVLRAAGVSLDITEQRRSEQNYQILFREMLDGFALHEIICTPEGKPVDYRFLAVNPAFETLTGLKAADVVGRTVVEVIPGTEPQWIQIYGEVALTGEPRRFEQYTAALGRHFMVAAFRPAPGQFACIFSDITDRLRAEAAARERDFWLRETQRVGRIGSYDFNITANRWTSSPVLDDLFGLEPDAEKTLEGWVALVHPEDRQAMQDYFLQEVCTGRRPFHREYRICRVANGETRWVWGHGEVTFDAAGRPCRMIGTIQDITERKLAAQALQAKDQQLANLVASLPDTLIFTVRLSPDGSRHFDHLSGAVEKILGCTPAAGLADVGLIYAAVVAEDRPALQAAEAQAAAEFQGFKHSFRLQPPGGPRRWVYLAARPRERAADGAVLFDGVVLDVTELKRVEAELMETRAVLQAAMDASLAGIAIADAPSGQLRYVNQAGLLIRGGSAVELVQGVDATRYVATWQLFQLDGTPLAADDVPLARAVRYGEAATNEFIVRRPSQEDRIVLANAAPIRNAAGEVTAGVSVFLDVTERRRTEQALTQTEAKFAQAFRTAPYAITITRLSDSRFIEVNEAFTTMTGYRRDEALASSALGLSLWTDLAERDQMLTTLREVGYITDQECHFRRRNQSILVGRLSARCLEMDGEMCLLASITDMTERKRAELELHTSELRFRRIFEEGPVGMVLFSQEMRFERVNAAFCRFLGYPEADLLGHTFTEFTHPDHVQQDLVAARRLLAGELPAYHTRKRYRRPDGQIVWGATSVAVVQSQSGEFLHGLAIIEDITERQRAEQRQRTYAELGRQLSAAPTVRAAAEVIVTAAKEVIGWDSCCFSLYHREVDRTEIMLSRDTFDGVVKDCPPAKPFAPPCPVDRLALEKGGQIILKEDPTAFVPGATPFGDQGRPSASLLWVPVYAGELPCALLTVQSYTPQAYTNADLDALQALANYCGAAVERIRAEDALRANEDRYRQLVDNSPLPILAHRDGLVIFANPAALKLFGATQPEHLLGTPVMERVHPEELALVRERQRILREEKQPVPMIEEKLRRLDGTLIYAEVAATPFTFQNKAAVQLVLRDVTDRHQAEAALHRQQTELKAIYEHAPVMMCVVDDQRKVVFANPAFRAFHELGPLDGVGLGTAFGCLQALADPRGCGYGPACERCQLRSAIADTFATGTGHHGVEFQTVIERGPARRTVTLLGSTARFEAEGQQHLLLCLHNITERKQAETALRIRDAAIDAALNAVAMADLSGRLTYVNAAFLRHWGYENKADVEGRPATSFWAAPEAAEAVQEALIAAGQWEGELTARRRDGTHFVARLSANLVRDPAGQPLCLLATFMDITRQKEAEKKLQEKVTSLENFQRLTVGRELQMIALKQEVNAALAQLGRPEKYKIVTRA